jgi:hypothetical protein
MKRFNVVGAFLLVVVVGCGGSDSVSPVESCNMGVAALCSRIYACYTAAELATAGYPATESACVTMNQASSGCAAKTTANACTGGNEVYHGEFVSGCIDQINGLTCAQVRDPALDTNVAAPICAKICSVPGA